MSHLMLVPSLACPASCAYCFGPHAGGATMGRETLTAIVEWQRALRATHDGHDLFDEGGRGEPGGRDTESRAGGVATSSMSESSPVRMGGPGSTTESIS